MTIAAAMLVSANQSSAPAIGAQSVQPAAPPKLRLPDEVAGIRGIAEALISVYDQELSGLFDVTLEYLSDRPTAVGVRVAATSMICPDTA